MVAGSLVWALSGVAVVRAGLGSTAPIAWAPIGFWLGFGAVFLSQSWKPKLDFRLSLALQALTAVGLVWTPHGGAFQAPLLVVVAGQLSAVFSPVASIAWIGAQTALAFAPRLWTDGLVSASPVTLGYFAFQLFAVGASDLAQSERRAREELTRAKAQMEEMQQRLAETTREAERLRIARELHDTLGHQLTALGLDLEAARHLATGDAAPPVQRARALVSSLMGSVRDAVTELREDSDIDLAAALRALGHPNGVPRVEVVVGTGLGHCPRDVSLALRRVAQEIVTNATKHANATTVRLMFRANDRAWTLEGQDDGLGAPRVCAGHGLSGMRERLEALGGTLAIVTAPGSGFTITATVPRAARR